MSVAFNGVDNTFVAKSGAGMVLAFVGRSRRGPTQESDGDPLTLASEPDVDRHIGLGTSTYITPGILKYAIGKGAQIKYYRVIAAGGVAAFRVLVDAGALNCLRIEAVNAGVWGNLVTVTIAADPSGDATLFSLTTAFSEQPGLGETYYNLSMDPTKANFVENVINGIDPLIKATALTAVVPANVGPVALAAGAASDTVTAANYQARLALFASERYITQLASDSGDGEVWADQAAYALTRKTFREIFSVPFGYTSTLAALFRQGSGGYGHEYVDNSYTSLYWGDVKDKRNGSGAPVAEWCHPLVLGQIALQMATGMPWYAVAGAKRGKIQVGLGMVENVLDKPAYDTLTGIEVNPIVTDTDLDTTAKITKIAESLTCQRARSKARFAEIREGVCWIRRRFLYHAQAIDFDPNEPEAWRQLYLLMKKDLDFMGSNRGLSGQETIGWQYVGDQEAINKDQATHNSQEELAKGNYTVDLYLSTIPGIRNITLNTILTESSAQFSEEVL